MMHSKWPLGICLVALVAAQACGGDDDDSKNTVDRGGGTAKGGGSSGGKTGAGGSEAQAGSSERGGTTSEETGGTTGEAGAPNTGTAGSGTEGGSAGAGNGTGGLTGEAGSAGSGAVDPAVCDGPDQYEKNNTFATAKAVSFNTNGALSISAGVQTADEDYYSITTPKADPVSVEVSYAVGALGTANLSFDVRTASDDYKTGDDTTRTGQSQVLSAVFESEATAHYAVHVMSDSESCTPYALKVNSTVCTDDYEDNEDFDAAYAIPLTGADKTASISPTIDGLDKDYFSFKAPKADPVAVTVTYTRPPQDTVDLSLNAYNQTQNYVTGDEKDRTGNSETFTIMWEPQEAGETQYLAVSSSVDGTCADYSLSIQGLYCTDDYEDNDSFSQARALPAGSHTAKVIDSDPDYYTIPAATGAGSCTVSYTTTGSSSQQLVVTLYGATGADAYISTDDTARTGASQTLTATWTADESPHYVAVTASQPECTSYTILCQ